MRYNPLEQVCCFDNVLDITSDNATYCCGQNFLYATAEYACCNYQLIQLSPSHPTRTECCDDVGLYDPLTDICCDGIAVKQRHGDTDICCEGNAFLPTSELCCDGNVVTKSSKNATMCCGPGVSLDPEIELCCDDVVVTKRSTLTEN